MARLNGFKAFDSAAKACNLTKKPLMFRGVNM